VSVYDQSLAVISKMAGLAKVLVTVITDRHQPMGGTITSSHDSNQKNKTTKSSIRNQFAVSSMKRFFQATELIHPDHNSKQELWLKFNGTGMECLCRMAGLCSCSRIRTPYSEEDS